MENDIFYDGIVFDEHILTTLNLELAILSANTKKERGEFASCKD